MPTITTKQGDRGQTRLFSNEIVPKTSSRIETIGDVDELVSFLGLARVYARHTYTKQILLYLQTTLFKINAEIAVQKVTSRRARGFLTPEDLYNLEDRRFHLESRVNVPQGFILPGEQKSAAYLDCCRAIARRCERRIVRLYERRMLKNKLIRVWLNRLSDVLYLLARFEEKKSRRSA